jgi:hypothetical protein
MSGKNSTLSRIAIFIIALFYSFSAFPQGKKAETLFNPMEMLAPVVKDYPYPLDATGELLAKDYDIALKEIREWFKKNPDYLLLTRIY